MQNDLMQRSGLNDIEQWYGDSQRKPLILRGARQVGKSTLVRLFCQQNDLSLFEVNLEKHRTLDRLFATLSISKILKELEDLFNFSISSAGVLFLDEIQEAPHAIEALRYFYEERPDIPVIAAGSLLEFALNEKGFSMPVGRVDYFQIDPMTFKEFLLAKDEKKILKEIEKSNFDEEVSDSFHYRAMELVKEYYATGGMPEAVKFHVRGAQPSQIAKIQKSLVETYKDDFSKYARRSDLYYLQKILEIAPGIIGKKIKYVDLFREEQARDIKKWFHLLFKSKILTPIFHSNCSGLPLSAQKNDHIYKIYFLDLGLLHYLQGLSFNEITRLDKTELLSLGSSAEQYVVQNLKPLLNTSLRELYYWLREGKTSNAEVDFVISMFGKIIPIEVKSGSSGTLRSLHQFMYEKQQPLAIRFNSEKLKKLPVSVKIPQNEKTLCVEYTLLSIPLYMVNEISRLLLLTE